MSKGVNRVLETIVHILNRDLRHLDHLKESQMNFPRELVFLLCFEPLEPSAFH
jgi:hypothetical protein